MYTNETSAGQGFHAEHTALLRAAGTHMPQQVSALDGIQRTLGGRQVPGTAFANVAGSPAATSGHQNNISDGVRRLLDAMGRLRDVIGGVRESDDGYRGFDRDNAGRIDEQGERVQQAQAQAQTGPVSQNGWPVNPPRGMRTVPGTNVRLNVANGPAGDVLMHVAQQVHNRVENIELDHPTEHVDDDWGYAERNVRGSNAISNHASATAIDLNAGRHDLGARGTYTPAQVTEIHSILGEVDGVVRWGGDYTGRLDEMHFEINATPEEVARVAERLRNAAAGQQ
jgi:D-alanyl-D-alanine carboxypeptidase-like protein